MEQTILAQVKDINRRKAEVSMHLKINKNLWRCNLQKKHALAMTTIELGQVAFKIYILIERGILIL